MAEFVRLCSTAELPPVGEATEISVGGHVICVANVRGTISAMDNVCLHRGGPLGQGTIEGDKLVCPWHGWTFDPRTGEAVHDRSAKVPVYAIKIEGDDVMIAL
jgi:nitrite reductase (NADH) small subunit